MAVTLQEGALAPDFELAGPQGPVELRHFRGHTVVLYFYPKDDTPGCTIEACEFGKQHDSFKRRDAVVLGVSPDDQASHAKFIKKFGLPFTLLSDEHHKAAEKYGVWVEKNNFGKTYMGVQRATFLIDEAGRLAKVWPKVSAEGHAAEVLAAIEDLGKALKAHRP